MVDGAVCFAKARPTMLFDAIDSVVLFTGRGGSGTRLLSQLADELGVFIGNHLNRSGDSIEWVKLIYRLAVEAAASGELPLGSRHRDEIRARAAEILSAGSTQASRLWGLKLPETMLVLPLLVDAFPQAKVVHLTRHPIPSSLRRTHMTSRLNNAVGAATLPNAYRFSNRDAGSIATDEPYLHNACSWNYQVRRVVDYGRASLGTGRYLEIRYEDVCAEPSSTVSITRSFLGCKAGGRPASITADASRVGDWDSRDPRIETIWKICGETASLLGYTLDRLAPARPDASSTQ
jgi:Sulfotransferase family